MAKIIDFIAEAAKKGNNRPLELLIQQAEDKVAGVCDEHVGKYGGNTVITDDPMKELSNVHRLAGFRSRREYFWHLSKMYQMDVNMIQHWALELGTEKDFTELIEKIHNNWDHGF